MAKRPLENPSFPDAPPVQNKMVSCSTAGLVSAALDQSVAEGGVVVQGGGCAACRAREEKAMVRQLFEDTDLVKAKRKWAAAVQLLVIFDVFVRVRFSPLQALVGVGRVVWCSASGQEEAA